MAELLIALLAVSVIVSATIPTFTRKASTNEQVFRFVDDNTGSGYGSSGNSSSIIVGGNRSIDETNNYTGYDAADQINVNNIDFDKMQLILSYEGGRNDEEASGDPTRSHLSFYNKNSDKTADNLHRVGRIYFDETNLGIGLHTLRYLVAGPGPNRANDFGRRNTAFGQLALYSIANGYDTTTDNFFGTDNTGVGYNTLTADTAKTYVDLTPSADYEIKSSGNNRKSFGMPVSSGNTAVGSFALTHNGPGSYNTAIGRSALYNHTFSSSTGKPTRTNNANTAVGFSAMAGGNAGESTIHKDKNQIHKLLCNNAESFNVWCSSEGLTGIKSEQLLHDTFGYGSGNTALGAFALSHLQKGTANVAIGALALHRYIGVNNGGLYSNKDYGNVAIGVEALGNLSIGTRNIAIGLEAAKHMVAGDDNIAIGFGALNNYNGGAVTSTIDGVTTVIGSGKDNIAIGTQALNNLRYGNYNTVIGNRSLNNAVGTNAGVNVSQNTVLGQDSFQSANSTSTKGNGNNVIIGTSTANNITNTSNSIIIGSSLGTERDTDDYQFVVGANGKKLLDGTIPTIPSGKTDDYGGIDIYGDSGFGYSHRESNKEHQDPVLRIYNSRDRSGAYIQGGMSVYKTHQTSGGPFQDNDEAFSVDRDDGTVNIFKKLAIYNADNKGKYVNLTVDSNGKVRISGDVTIAGDLTVTGNISGNGSNLTNLNANNITTGKLPHSKIESHYHYEYSDARLKNILSDSTAGLKEINALEIKNFTFKKDEKKTPHVGVIAQQLQKIFPNAVTKDDEGYLMIRTEDIFYAMVNSIKELYKNIQELTAKVTGLDKKITELEKQNKELIEQNKAFEERLKKLESKVE